MGSRSPSLSSTSCSNMFSAPSIALKKVTLKVTKNIGVKTKQNKINVKIKKSFKRAKTRVTKLTKVKQKVGNKDKSK